MSRPVNLPRAQYLWPAAVHITRRLVISLVAVVATVATVAAILQVRSERSTQESELYRRSQLLAESLREAVEPLLVTGVTSQAQ